MGGHHGTGAAADHHILQPRCTATTDVDEWVTVIAPPVWTWHSVDMLSGEFMVAAATTDAHAYPTTNHEAVVKVGLVPLMRLLDNSAAQPIEL